MPNKMRESDAARNINLANDCVNTCHRGHSLFWDGHSSVKGIKLSIRVKRIQFQVLNSISETRNEKTILGTGPNTWCENKL